MKRIEKVLNREIGLSAESIGASALELAVNTRLRARAIADRTEYADCLERDPEERRALVEEIVVSETWFFRDDQVFRTLSRLATTWSSARAGETLRVLSIPCATGEEAYSVAIVFAEAGLSPAQFAVEAVDVSERALTLAKRARYGKHSFRSANWQRYRSFFAAAEGGFEVTESVRAGVAFSRGNVLEPRPGWVRRFDLVLCRNLLIYLDRDARCRALENLHGWLAPEGILFSGHAEALEAMDPRFQRVDSETHFAYRKKPAPQPKLPAVETKALVSTAFEPKPRTPAARRSQETSSAVSGPATGASARKAALRPGLAATSSTSARNASDSLAEATELANRGALAEAVIACERHIQDFGPSADAYCLLGVVRQAGLDSKRAIESFNKALYLDPPHHETLVHLALIYERLGDTARALQYRRRAERAQTKGAAG